MFRNLMICLFFVNPIMAFAEPRILGYNRMNFREFAKLSAILNQCEMKELDIDKINILKSSKIEGLNLAKKENLSNENIAKEVAEILYDLDKAYPEEIPYPICISALKDFQNYVKKVTNEIKS